MHRPSLRITILAGMLVAAAAAGGTAQPIPDPAYGGNGDGIARVPAALVPTEITGFAQHAVVQADGRLVLVGTAQHTVDNHREGQIVLMRLDAEGRLDDSFGADHDGLVRTAFTGGATDVAQTADGRLVYTGDALNSDSMIVGRLAADGTPDTSFFGSGRRLIGPSALMDDATLGDFANILPLANGKTLAIGLVVVQSSPAQYFSCAMRLRADGTTDTNFGNAGRTCIAPPMPSGAASQAFAGVTLAGDRIVFAGCSRHSGGSGWDMSVARLDANGALDTGFGPAHDGWAFVGFDQGGTMSDCVSAIAIDLQGRILLAGFLEGVNGTDIGVVRLLPGGEPDPSFGISGRVQLALDLGGFNHDRAHSIAVLPDGDILIGGYSDTSVDSVSVAIRLKDDGQLDPRFGDGGIFLQADPDAPRTAQVVSQQQFLAGDHLYMVGSVGNDSGRRDFAATRFVLPLFADGFDD